MCSLENVTGRNLGAEIGEVVGEEIKVVFGTEKREIFIIYTSEMHSKIYGQFENFFLVALSNQFSKEFKNKVLSPV